MRVRSVFGLGGCLLVLGYGAMLWSDAETSEAEATRALERLPHTLRPPRLTPPPQGAWLGAIQIPRIKVSLPVIEGAEDAPLLRGVGHIEGTALPGLRGNVGLAGHRDTVFRPLREIAKGDDVLVTTATGSTLYRVEETRIVTPRDVDVLAPTKADVLTLVTCHPFFYVGHAPNRFIVRARAVKSS